MLVEHEAGIGYTASIGRKRERERQERDNHGNTELETWRLNSAANQCEIHKHQSAPPVFKPFINLICCVTN